MDAFEHENPYLAPTSPTPVVESRQARRPGWLSTVRALITASLGVGAFLSNLSAYAFIVGLVHKFGFWKVIIHQEMSSIYTGAVFTLLTLAASWDLFRSRWPRAVAEIVAAVILSWIFFAIGLYSRGF